MCLKFHNFKNKIRNITLFFLQLAMSVGLFGVICVTFFLRANCDDDNFELARMKAKMDAMEKSLEKMDAMERRIEKLDTKEKQCFAEIDVLKKRYAVLQQQQGKSLFISEENATKEVK